LPTLIVSEILFSIYLQTICPLLDTLPKHFKEIRVPTSSSNSYMSKTSTTGGEIEPFSSEARSVGRITAVQALLAGSALCLTVSSMIAWGIGRMLGVHNVSRIILVDMPYSLSANC
jgi:hypothetical protein